MDALRLAFLIALVAVPAAARQAPPPPVPADLAAANRVQVIDIRVTDPAGMPIQPAHVRWFSPSGAMSAAQTGRAGQFAMGPNLQYSAAGGWRFLMAGPHRFEVSADGFQTTTVDADLKPGTTVRLAVTLQPLPPRQVFAPELYRQKILELATKNMPANQEVRIVGTPVTMPDVIRTRVSTAARLPEAIATFAVYEKGRFRDVGLASFVGSNVNSRLSNADQQFEQMDEKEWQEMASVLDGFFADAVDVTRGSERFLPYLPDNMRQMLDLRAEKNRMWLRPDAVQSLSNDQLRRFVSLMFDQAVLAVWVAVSGLPSPPPGGRPADIRRDPVAAIALLESSTAAMRKILVDGGIVTRPMMAETQMYVRRMLGDGYIVRENPNRDGIRLPRGARMYTVMLGGPLPHVIVDRDRLRVVAVDFF